MNDILAQRFTLLNFTPGRMVWAAQGVKQQDLGNERIEKAAGRVIDSGRLAVKLDREYRAAREAKRGARFAPELLKLDPQLDRIVKAIHDVPAAWIRTMSESDPGTQELSVNLASAFPEGPGAITSKPFPEQAAAIDDLLELFAGKLSHFRDRFQLGELLRELESVNAAFKSALPKTVTGEVSFSQFESARNEAQGRLIVLVAIICGEYAEEPAKLRRALAPILEQQELIRAARNRRRNVPDIDPATGELLVDTLIES